ncbi:MAG: creatininase family protein [Planctomycetota bacterium]|jgi:creatinine amidohydrolase
MRFGDLTYEEIKRLAESGALAVIPTGCTEQQGPHLTVDSDTWFAETVCVCGAERAKAVYGLDAVVLPACPFGPTPEHRAFGAGFVDIPVKLHQDLVLAALESVADQGFRKIVVWRGCGGHRLDGVVDRFNSARNGSARAFLPGQPYHDIWMQYGDARDPGGHADSFATSIALYLRPDHVRRDMIVDSGCRPVDWADPNLNFADYSPNGVVGTPIYASAELGETLWKEVVKHVADTFKKIAEA